MKMIQALGSGSSALGLGFFLHGGATVLMGPWISVVSPEWPVTAAEAGILFTAQFTAAAFGSVLSSLHLRRALLAGYAALALGLGLLATGSWAIAPWGAAVLGLGVGLVAPATNLLVASRNPESRAAAVAKLNFLWGLGAAFWPSMLAPLLGTAPPGVLPGGMALSAFGIGLWLTLGRAPIPATVGASTRRDGGGSAGSAVALVGALLFLYVGVETTLGGWLAPYANQVLAGGDAGSVMVASGFWWALLAGRAAAPWLIPRIGERLLFAVSVALALAATAALLAASSLAAASVAAVASGLGLAPLFPLLVAILSRRTEASGGRSAGIAFAFSSLGGASLPWLAAQVGAGAGEGGGVDLGMVFWVPLAELVGIAGLYGLLVRGGGVGDPR
ncbi:MAG: MFS transporter [Acidobacteriota bacterium]